MDEFLSLNRKMCVTALRGVITHYGCFKDVSAVTDTSSLCIVSCAACLNFEVDNLCSSQSVLWDQMGTACSLFLIPLFSHSENSCHALVRT